MSVIKFNYVARKLFATTLISVCTLAASASYAAATFEITAFDDAGKGFFDPTPVAAVGSNNATTLGEQRQAVLNRVIERWSSTLSNTTPIQLLAGFAPLPCGVLAATGPTNFYHNFPGAPLKDTWYPSALANKLSGQDLNPGNEKIEQFDILLRINQNLNDPACNFPFKLDFYLGLDDKADGLENLSTILLHELNHGFGFIRFANRQTEEYIDNTPPIYDNFVFDLSTGKRYVNMTPAERLVSRVNPRKVAWLGLQTRAQAGKVLGRNGTPELFVASPNINDFILAGGASFGTTLKEFPTAGRIVRTSTDYCTPYTGNEVKGNIVFIELPGSACSLSTKLKNAQDAGAKAVIRAVLSPGSPPPTLDTNFDGITIPWVLISQEDGKRLVNAGVDQGAGYAVLRLNKFVLDGTTYGNFPLLYTPSSFAGGSSLSHFDTFAIGNRGQDLLMEPFATPKQLFENDSPFDLSFPLLKDQGW